MPRKKDDGQYSEQEAKQRFENALRGSRHVGPQPMKTVSPKRHKRLEIEQMPEGNDPEALMDWAKRNIQRD